MLGKILQGFVEQHPILMLVRGTLERVFSDKSLNQRYDETKHTEYTRTLRYLICGSK